MPPSSAPSSSAAGPGSERHGLRVLHRVRRCPASRAGDADHLPGRRVVLLPTVGCFTPGYCLFMPLEHLDAAADTPPGELRDVAGAAESMRALISSVSGPVVIAEHGPRGCETGA